MKNVALLFLVVFLFFALGCDNGESNAFEEESLEERVALEWIQNSSTYTQRGGSDLQIESIDGNEVVASFSASIAGYGETEEGDATAFPTNNLTHEIVLTVGEDGELTSAVINEKYDELEGEFIVTPEWILLVNLLGENLEEAKEVASKICEDPEVRTNEEMQRTGILCEEKNLAFYIEKDVVIRIDYMEGEFIGINLSGEYDAKEIYSTLGLPERRADTEGTDIEYMQYILDDIWVVFYDEADFPFSVSLYYYEG